MPRKAGTICSRAGCAGIVRDGVCSVCGPRRVQRNAEYDARRGTAAQRGYGGRWQRAREIYLRAHPLCVACAVEGRATPATDVHHLRPLRDGGTDAPDNLQALCHACHSRVTMGGG